MTLYLEPSSVKKLENFEGILRKDEYVNEMVSARCKSMWILLEKLTKRQLLLIEIKLNL